eukprot:3328356-Amphidinium_carterae.2
MRGTCEAFERHQFFQLILQDRSRERDYDRDRDRPLAATHTPENLLVQSCDTGTGTKTGTGTEIEIEIGIAIGATTSCHAVFLSDIGPQDSGQERNGGQISLPTCAQPALLSITCRCWG